MSFDRTALKMLENQIYSYCGIRYGDQLDSLQSKISDRIRELGVSLWTYLERLKNHPEEWDHLIERITLNETYFFREENQLRDFVEVLKKWPHDRNGKIRIWSAACSTGEEPYTLAMLIADSGVVPLERVEIIASDINKKALRTAETGWYPKNSLSFRRTPWEIKKKYFDEKGDGFQVKPFIAERVRFTYLNLLGDRREYERIGKADIVFCRNVLIYFDRDAIAEIADRLYKTLNPGGYLFLGHSETLQDHRHLFDVIFTDFSYYYRRKEQSEKRNAAGTT